jgi:hypothetical protein
MTPGQTLLLRLGLTLSLILFTPSSEVRFRWIDIFLSVGVVSLASNTLQHDGPYRLLSIAHSLPLTRGAPHLSLEISIIIFLCSWVLLS